MRALWRDLRSFSPTVRLLMVNQLGINTGFYLLMPYLAGHLSGDLKLAGWAVGLSLGVRNLSQQGMFLFGGSLADRFGPTGLIISGCALRVVAFALLGFATGLSAVLLASVLTGLAGALFNPAVRAYLAQDAGARRVEAFAVFNVFYQAGILIGPPLGLLLTVVGFRAASLSAAGVFAALTAAQLRWLPRRDPASVPGAAPMRAGWAIALRNRAFLAFAAAMSGSYILSFQIYLLLPLQVEAVGGQLGVSVLFAAAAAAGIAGQLRVTAWCRARLTPAQCLCCGVALMALAFLPPAITAGGPGHQDALAARLAWAAPAVIAALALTLGTAVAYPFEMDTITRLAGDRLVGTHYGLYSTITGLAITLGNLGTGALLDWATRRGHPALPYLALATLGAGSALALALLTRSARWQTHAHPIAA